MGQVVHFDLVSDDIEESSGDRGTTFSVESLYECLVTDPETAHVDLKRARPDLLRYNPHPLNNTFPRPVYVNRWKLSPEEKDPCLFSLSVSYGTSDIEGGGDSNSPENRFLIRTPTWRSTYKTEQILRSPNTNKPFLNSVGDPITGIQEERAFWTAEYAFNVPSRPVWLERYAGAINSDEITLDGVKYGPRRVAMGELTITPQIDEDGVEYRSVALQLVTHPEEDGWLRQFPNVGYYELADEIGRVYLGGGVYGQGPTGRRKRVRIVDEESEPVEQPAWIDPFGRAIRAPAAPNATANTTGSSRTTKQPLKVPLDEADFVWLGIDTKKQLPFNLLRLR